MKFKKNKLSHWYYLLISAIFYIILVPIAYFVKRPQKKIVILYGHKFNGNLRAFYEFRLKNEKDLSTYYLSMDKEYVRNLSDKKLPVLWTGSLIDMIKVSLSSVIISDHHPQLNKLYIYNSKIKFVDVWHGIPFKGYEPSAFGFLKRYNQIWTNSSYMASIYSSKYKIPLDLIQITGYGRVDPLINKLYNKEELLNKYNIGSFKHIVLIAPTWMQDDKKRNILPFDVNAEDFIESINYIGKQNDALFIIRAHLNVNQAIGKPMGNVKIMPYSRFPIAEEFLFIADILVSDWSSIVFDYLVLDRPIIFFDVEAPFRNHFTYSPENRVGFIASSLRDFYESLNLFINNPKLFSAQYIEEVFETRKIVYGGTDDGNSLDRYYSNLRDIIDYHV